MSDPGSLIDSFQASWAWLMVVSMATLLALSGWGRLWLHLIPCLRLNTAPIPLFCESLLHGFVTFSIAGLGGVMLGFPLITTFAAISSAVALVGSMSWWRSRIRSAAAPQRDVASSFDNRLHMIAVMAIGLGSILWSANNLQGLVASDGDVMLVPWLDFFYHGRQIGNFANFRGDFGSLHPTMVGAKLPFYHYGSYMVPSLAADLGDLPALQVATSLYPVLGMLLTGAAMLVLANVTAGPASALMAIMILYFVPDPSSWVPGSNRWYSYFFFQQVGVGGAYALAVMGLALAYAVRGLQLGSLLLCFLGLATFAVAGLFKIQILLAYSLPYSLYVFWNAPWRSRLERPLAIGIVGGAFCLALSYMDRFAGAPRLSISIANVESTLAKAAGTLPTLIDHAPHATLWLLLPLVLIGLLARTYGVLAPLLAYLAWSRRHDASTRHLLGLLLVTLSAQAMLRFAVADDQGTGYLGEINRKTVVWPYFVVVYCSAVLLSHQVAQWRLVWSRGRIWLVGILAGAVIGLCAIFAKGLQTFPGLSDSYARQVIPAGLFASANFLRAGAAPTEVVQLCENDQLNILGTLSERPVFVAKMVAYAFPYTALERERFDAVERVLRQASAAQAFEILKGAGISWLLMSPACRAPWEAEYSPVFKHSDYRLYRLPASLSVH